MIKVKRLRHVTFVTPDIDRQIDYYQTVVGLGVVTRDASHASLATDSDELAVVLQRGDQAACRRLTFEVAPDLDFADLVATLSRAGIAAEIQSDPLPGVSRSVLFRDFEEMEIELLAGPTFAVAEQPVGGIAADRLGHIALYTQDPLKASKFYGDVLNFRVSDWIEDAFVFMRCGVDHHSVNFARGPGRRLHHAAFELRDASHMHRACDLLGRKKMQILWGPVRHGPGHNVAIYHRDPDGHLIELFFDLDQMIDEDLGYFEPRPWHRDRPQRPKVWVGLPRDIWGPAPSPELAEFKRKAT
ncbi:VOC family protein [Tardiphaga sp. OK245]|uniref:VOC family protein n=1 Tax=Tardiphaga sp. OK245 TaxID=1855306 RepID=UPI0008A74698|nr:VOC family protein [Tardiphaga sp. OK245]SEH44850.1 Catechol-2,3-dioxygenase [Tardiphaga sp. OK245]